MSLFDQLESNEARRIEFPPLYWDVLSGEFHPPQDPEQHTHTLAKLAFASASKGRSSLMLDEPGRIMNTYRPSWAPAIGAHTSGVTDMNSILVDSLYLKGAETDQLEVSIEGDELTIMDETYKLEHGRMLLIARQVIAVAAQDFFNRN